MARFLVTYHTGDMPHDLESMAKAREAFMTWATKTGTALVDPGAPTKSTSTVAAGGWDPTGHSDEPFTGWSVIEAADVAAAADLLSDHPFIGRGGTLQISEPVEF